MVNRNNVAAQRRAATLGRERSIIFIFFPLAFPDFTTHFRTTTHSLSLVSDESMTASRGIITHIECLVKIFCLPSRTVGRLLPDQVHGLDGQIPVGIENLKAPLLLFQICRLVSPELFLHRVLVKRLI